MSHKQCLNKALMHHHDNIFGCAYVGSLLPSTMQQNCGISSLFMTLSKFLSDAVDRDIVLRTLHLMTSCGTCCCFPALVLLKKVVRLIMNSDQRIRSSGLVLLERTFYKQFGGFEENTSCELCARNCQFENIDGSSKFSSVDVSPTHASQSTEIRALKWSCLSVFKDILLSSDQKVVLMAGGHLLRIIPYCKVAVKQEILFSVFHPVFIRARERYSENDLELDKFFILTCLSVFTNLLRKVKIVDQFIEQKTISHIIELLQDKDAMKLCCSIIEIIIISQIWKTEQSLFSSKDIKKEIFFKSSVIIPEFDILLEKIRWSSTECLSLVLNEEGSEVSNCAGDASLKFDSPELYQQYSQLLGSLTFLWRTLANLSLFSPQVRQSVKERTATVPAHILLTTLLKRIIKPVMIQEELLVDKDGCLSHLHLKLVEPLLVLCLVCPPAADNPETFVSCESMLQLLKPLFEAAIAESSVTIRQLCDFLYRASLAQPSQRLMIPTHKMPKVGSLPWEGGEPMITHSSSSVIDREPLDDTMSDCDTNAELTADEGYDADVEIRDQRSEQADDTSSGLLSASGGRKVSLDQRKPDEIIHPELCILAVDLVSNFIQNDKISESQLLDCVYSIQKLSRENCHQLIHLLHFIS